MITVDKKTFNDKSKTYTGSKKRYRINRYWKNSLKRKLKKFYLGLVTKNEVQSLISKMRKRPQAVPINKLNRTLSKISKFVI